VAAELTWQTVYDDAVSAFGDTPGAALERSIVEAFERQPLAVQAAIGKLAARFAAGKVRSPWPLVLREIESVDRASVVADSRIEFAQCIRLAESWIRNAGLYCPPAEVGRELFGDRGRLHAWRDDADVRRRIAELWIAEQPRAELSIAESRERAQRWRAAFDARQAGEAAPSTGAPAANDPPGEDPYGHPPLASRPTFTPALPSASRFVPATQS
jgi:hypothetical protein